MLPLDNSVRNRLEIKMDVNVALANLRNMMKAKVFRTNAHAVLARDAFEALDGWIMRGGFLPDDWAKAQDADKAALRAALGREPWSQTS